MSRSPYIFAIVGLGPRGHYSLESLLGSLCNAEISAGFKVLGFEQSDAVGYGPVYATDQPDSNWINIAERTLDLPSRSEMVFATFKIPAFAGYLEWAKIDLARYPDDSEDIFPPRAKIGRYLRDRFLTMKSALIEAGVFELIHDPVEAISNSENAWEINTKSGAAHRADDILLTVGHQPTERDDQIKTWRKLEKKSDKIALFDEPYPIAPILEASKHSGKTRIAIRGYGLATIDVVRAVACQFGEFQRAGSAAEPLRYALRDDADVVMAPFSLDGLTMGPKPLTLAMDEQFAPPQAALKTLSEHLMNPDAQKGAKGAHFLTDAAVPIAVSVFLSLTDRFATEGLSRAELEFTASNWIEDQTFEHASMLNAQTAHDEMLEALIAMGKGQRAISLDYCIGQVWRHCQPTIYTALSHGALADDVMADIISTDERMKRYAYGPPVESSEQLLALHRAGVFDLDFVNNPEITTSDAAWTLSNGHRKFAAEIMVDAVLDSPQIKSVTSTLFLSLLDDGLIHAVHDDFGVSTGEDGYITTGNRNNNVPIALLGRLAKGTVIGVDAILECFGKGVKIWSNAAVLRALPSLPFTSHR